MQQQNSPKAIGGLVCGVVSLVFLLIGLFLWFICFIGLAIGIVGLVLSIMARKEMPSSYGNGRFDYFYYRRFSLCINWSKLCNLLLCCSKYLWQRCEFSEPVG